MSATQPLVELVGADEKRGADDVATLLSTALDLAATIAFVLLAVGFLIPAAGILVLGVRDADGTWTSAHLMRFLTDPFYLGIGWRTVKLSLLLTVICVVAGTPLAYIMARSGPRLRLWLIVCITLPLMTSVVVRTFGWMVVLGRGGLVPDALKMLGMVNRNYTLMHTDVDADRKLTSKAG